jgi:hypothetical protein
MLSKIMEEGGDYNRKRCVSADCPEPRCVEGERLNPELKIVFALMDLINKPDQCPSDAVIGTLLTSHRMAKALKGCSRGAWACKRRSFSFAFSPPILFLQTHGSHLRARVSHPPLKHTTITWIRNLQRLFQNCFLSACFEILHQTCNCKFIL